MNDSGRACDYAGGRPCDVLSCLADRGTQLIITRGVIVPEQHWFVRTYNIASEKGACMSWLSTNIRKAINRYQEP